MVARYGRPAQQYTEHMYNLYCVLLQVAPELGDDLQGASGAAAPGSTHIPIPQPPTIPATAPPQTTSTAAGPQGLAGAGLQAVPNPVPLPTASGKPLFSFPGFGGAGASGGAAVTPTASLFPAAGNLPTSAASLFPSGGLATSSHGAGNAGSSSGNAPTTGFSSFPMSFPAGFPGMGGKPGGLGGAENAILEKLKRAADRERQLAALKAEEGKE